MPTEVSIKFAKTSYGADDTDSLYDNLGTTTLKGYDLGDIETGVDQPINTLFLRTDGLEVIYNCGFFLRAVGLEWGGYVPSADTALRPYNPNFFRSGGLDGLGNPQQSTADYEFMRLEARNNPEMGLRLHLDRSNTSTRTNGLGYNNTGLSFSPIQLPLSAMSYTQPSSNTPLAGRIYPDPVDPVKRGNVGDEAKIGVSFKLGDDVIGSGIVQIGLAIVYRYTT